MGALEPVVVDAIWQAVEGLLPSSPIDGHLLGCHRARVPDQVRFEGILIQAIPRRLRVLMSSQLKNPESARNVNAPTAPARRTRATSSSTKRLWPRWEEPLRSRACRTSPVSARVAI